MDKQNILFTSISPTSFFCIALCTYATVKAADYADMNKWIQALLSNPVRVSYTSSRSFLFYPTPPSPSPSFILFYFALFPAAFSAIFRHFFRHFFLYVFALSFLVSISRVGSHLIYYIAITTNLLFKTGRIYDDTRLKRRKQPRELERERSFQFGSDY